jgi:hypothetical protein
MDYGTFWGCAVGGENPDPDMFYGANDMGAPGAAKLVIKDQYVNDGTTTLKVNVTPGKDIDLEVGQ